MTSFSFSRKDRQGIALFAGSLIVVVTLAILSIFARDSKRYDEQTFCPTDEVFRHTVVLIDKTDPLSASQRHFITNMVVGLKSVVQPREKLSIYILDDLNYQLPEPVFAACNPGSGEKANALYQNPRMIQQRFDAFFGGPLKIAVDELMEVSETQWSPIMEMIQQISFIPDFEVGRPGRQLIVVSDMIQNMPAYSQYKRQMEYSNFAQTEYARTVLPNLMGVPIHIYYLWRARPDGLQGDMHIQFWRRYFEAAGARLQDIQRLP